MILVRIRVAVDDNLLEAIKVYVDTHVAGVLKG